MSRWGRPVRQSGRNHAAKGGAVAAPALPELANIIYRFDSTDITTLWKDEARTDPVTTDGDAIRGWTNLGSLDIHAAVGNSAYAPAWNTAKGQQKFDGTDAFLVNALEVDETSFSFALLAYENPVTSKNGAMIVWEWLDFSTRGVRCDFTADAMSLWHNSLHGQRSPATLGSGVGPFSDICASTANDQESWFNSQSASVTSSGGYDNSPTADLHIGANNATGANGWQGWIGELIIWGGVRLTTADAAAIKAYDTYKFGTVWA